MRLDRALATGDWCSLFPLATVQHLSAVKSDHSPILLMNSMEAHNQRIANAQPFRYECMWERHDDFNRVLEEAWGSSQANTARDITEKLQAIAASLSGWGTSTFGAVRQDLRALRKGLLELRSVTPRVGPSYEEIKVEQRIIELRFREEVMWRQRAHVQWMLEGDRNTRFFQQKASNRRKKNRVDRLVRADETICEDLATVEHMTVEYYEHLYASEGVIGIEEVLSHVPCKVTPEMNEVLQSYRNHIQKLRLKPLCSKCSQQKLRGPMVFRHISSRNIGIYTARK